MIRVKKIIKIIFRFAVYAFAVFGFSMTAVFFAAKLHLTDVPGVIDSQNYFTDSAKGDPLAVVNPNASADWMKIEAWNILKEGIAKDKDQVTMAAMATGIPARLIVAQIVPEQLRLFTSERETFKQVFAPLRVLGTESQFSLGVTGIKIETAKMIENNLTDASSPQYPGQKYEHLLDFTTPDHDTERLERLTDYKNHYYSYLYTALFIKEIEMQWYKAGFPIDSRPEIISTIFNIGFDKSVPKADPAVGGAEIDLNGSAYSFGGIAYDFYASGEMTDIFPR